LTQAGQKGCRAVCPNSAKWAYLSEFKPGYTKILPKFVIFEPALSFVFSILLTGGYLKMANKTIQNEQVTHLADIASEAMSACAQKAEENRRMSSSIIDSLHTLNAKLCELDNALKIAYNV
jgi:hypothetical protein